MRTQQTSLEQWKEQIARRLSDYKVQSGEGEVGTLSISLAQGVTRTLKAHWSGFKLFYPTPTLILYAELRDGRFWSEGYISDRQPSWVLTFRRDPHPSRGTGGPRPEDEYAPPQHYDNAIELRKRWLERGIVRQEELIRMEDNDDPAEAIDQFFNYTALYVLKSVDADWSQFGYKVDASVGWAQLENLIAATPIDAAIDEGLKKSDILWLTPDTDPNRRPVPCWFIYTKERRLFVLSGERQQIIPHAARVREAHIVTRWKGRDARLSEFDALVRPITAADGPEFEEIAHQLINKRQSVREEPERIVERWKREAVILELIPVV